jgi:hypothetical protein
VSRSHRLAGDLPVLDIYPSDQGGIFLARLFDTVIGQSLQVTIGSLSPASRRDQTSGCPKVSRVVITLPRPRRVEDNAPYQLHRLSLGIGIFMFFFRRRSEAAEQAVSFTIWAG